MAESELLTGALEPTNESYAIAKIAGIKLCQAYRRQYGANFISAMPTNLYGPNDNFDLKNSHVLPAMMRKFHDAKEAGVREVVIWGTGTPRREFLHVDDLADACVFLMAALRGEGHVNVGTGRGLEHPRAGGDAARDHLSRGRAHLGHRQARRHAAQAAGRVARCTASAGATRSRCAKASRRPTSGSSRTTRRCERTHEASVAVAAVRDPQRPSERERTKKRPGPRRTRPFSPPERIDLPVHANTEPDDPRGHDRLNVVAVRGVLVAAQGLDGVVVGHVEDVHGRHEVHRPERHRTLHVEVQVLERRQAVLADVSRMIVGVPPPLGSVVTV